ncbi:hypothetical protein Ae201684_008864 [Aphanomyces euteiches]|uniref:FYVE-type domain-containing protein n=1 Tax=Aphanomyces euteiches TaxID=100861 RepID=A0A6G0X3A6_9STRA|nr:hypothetical protein Ae201684_008864 [Aphanomyces euteiches]
MRRNGSGSLASLLLMKLRRRHSCPIKWELDSDEHDLQLYKGMNPSATPGATGATAYFSTIEVVGSMNEVFDLFRSQTTDEAKEYCRRFGKTLIDAVNLYSIVPATPEAPHEMIGVSWRAFKGSVDKVVKLRDACIVDVHHAFEFKGRKVWVRCMKSYDMACCPDLQDELGYVRMTIHLTGHVFWDSEKPGYLNVAYILQSDVKGTKRCRNLTDIDRFLRENRLSKTPFLNLEDLKPSTLTGTCFLCRRRFGTFSKKLNCTKCGEVCCRRCIQLWNVKNRGFDAQALVCNKCALGNPDDFKGSRWWNEGSNSYGVTSSDSDGGSGGLDYVTVGQQYRQLSKPQRQKSQGSGGLKLHVPSSSSWKSPRAQY